MQIALIGLPLAGKKTLFRLLTGQGVPPTRRPVDIVHGHAPIRDPRVDELAAICKPQKVVYAVNDFVLCPDASTGADTRAWLDAARRCDLICLVLGAYAGSTGQPQRDREALESELLLADMALIETRLTRLEKETRAHRAPPEKAIEERALTRAMEALSNGSRLQDAALSPPEKAAIKSLHLLTCIPLLPAYNVAEDALTAGEPQRVNVSARLEEEISRIDDAAERREYLQAMGIERPGIDRMNAAAYDALGLMSFYTIGPDEVRAWTIRKGSLAPTAGGKVHTDIERGFIRVEVIKYEDFLCAGSEKAARDQGKMQIKGKDYALEDGDICHFLFNV